MKSHNSDTCIDNLWQAVNNLGHRLSNLEVNSGRSHLHTCTYADELHHRITNLEQYETRITRLETKTGDSTHNRLIGRLQDIHDRAIYSSGDREALDYAIRQLTQP